MVLKHNHTGILGPDNLKELYQFTKRAESNWRSVGSGLGFSFEDLNAVVRTPGLYGDADYFQQVLLLWLKNNSDATKHVLAEALHQAKEERLAFNLLQSFTPAEGNFVS